MPPGQYRTVIMDPVKRGKKKNFTDNEVEVLLNEVQLNKTVLFAAFSGGMSKKKKTWRGDRLLMR